MKGKNEHKILLNSTVFRRAGNAFLPRGSIEVRANKGS